MNTGHVKNGYTEDDLLQLVRTTVSEIGSQKEAAEAFGVSASFLNDVLHGRRDVGPTIARHFSLEPTVLYQRSHYD